MNDTILINRLPTRTWNRLGVNETAIPWGQADDLGEEKITAAGQTERLEITGSGERGEKTVDIHAPAGQTVTVFETLRAEKGLLVRTALHVEKDAKVRLVQIQNAAQDSLLRLETSGECAENGQVELIQVLLGRGDVYSDGQFELNGNGAGFTAGIGYLGQKQQTVDMNLVVNHWGQKTTSEINAAGALKDDAQKIFRGTIDFKKGSAGSVGSEQETVLMLGDGVVNKTVPLILCAEENVVGNHGATIGDRVIVGMGATVLDGAVIGNDCIIGAGALVTGKMNAPDGSMILGSPAKVVRELTDKEKESILANAALYLEKSKESHAAKQA